MVSTKKLIVILQRYTIEEDDQIFVDEEDVFGISFEMDDYDDTSPVCQEKGK